MPQVTQYSGCCTEKSRSSNLKIAIRASWTDTYVTRWFGPPSVYSGRTFFWSGWLLRRGANSAMWRTGDEGSQTASFQETNTFPLYHKPAVSVGFSFTRTTLGMMLNLVKLWSATSTLDPTLNQHSSPALCCRYRKTWFTYLHEVFVV